jgi:hypothetical protein
LFKYIDRVAKVARRQAERLAERQATAVAAL